MMRGFPLLIPQMSTRIRMARDRVIAKAGAVRCSDSLGGAASKEFIGCVEKLKFES